MVVDFDEIDEFARGCFNTANEGAKAIQLSLEESVKYAKSHEIRAGALYDRPEFKEIENGFGIAAYAVILAVDLRRSSWMAEKFGPKPMHLTMHTYLPTMVELINRMGGTVIGLRGDGLIAGFGITEKDGEKQVFTTEISNKAIYAATDCAKAMIEAIEGVINPLMNRNQLYDQLQIGVAIGFGPIVITRIGVGGVNELTTYGTAVNKACKLTSERQNEVIMTTSAKDIYPKAEGGKMGFRQVPDGFIVQYPPDRNVLVKSPAKPKPR